MNDKYSFRRDLPDYGNYLITDQLEVNLSTWLSWAFLNIGAFENVILNEVGTFGGDKSRLRPFNDPRNSGNSNTSSKIWQANRGDWCWETGINYSTQPISISGVWINNNFYPTTGITNTYYINYPNGQVVFSGAIPTTSIVQLEYSPRLISIRRSDDSWFKSVLNGSLRVDDPQFSTNSPSGQWTILPENRVALPVIVIEPILDGESYPYEIGGSGRIHQEGFLLHSITETPSDRNILTSILRDQIDKRIISFDRNIIDYPLDYFGRPTPSAMTYPQLCENHPWLQIRVVKTNITNQEAIGNKIWWSTTKLTLEVDAP